MHVLVGDGTVIECSAPMAIAAMVQMDCAPQCMVLLVELYQATIMMLN